MFGFFRLLPLLLCFPPSWSPSQALVFASLSLSLVLLSLSLFPLVQIVVAAVVVVVAEISGSVVFPSSSWIVIAHTERRERHDRASAENKDNYLDQCFSLVLSSLEGLDGRISSGFTESRRDPRSRTRIKDLGHLNSR